MNKGVPITKNGKVYGTRIDGTPDRRFKAWRGKLPMRLRYAKPTPKKVVYVDPWWVKLAKLVILGCLLIANFFIWQEVYIRSQREYEVISPRVGEPLNDKNTICVGEMNKLFCKAWYGWDYEKIIKIAQCESGLNPEAWRVNYHADGVISVDRGLLQVNSYFHPNYTPSEMFDPQANVRAGYKIWQKSGYGPWEASSSCWRNL